MTSWQFESIEFARVHSWSILREIDEYSSGQHVQTLGNSRRRENVRCVGPFKEIVFVRRETVLKKKMNIARVSL